MAAIIKPIGIVKDDEEEDNLTPMNINKFHMITHENKLTLKHTAKRLGFKLYGDYADCIHCCRAKAKHKKISKFECVYFSF